MATEIVELSTAYRERAARLRLKARAADRARAQSLLLLAEEYDYRAQRMERRRAALGGGAQRDPKRGEANASAMMSSAAE